MVTLVEFLTARLDEDEAVAQPWLGRGPWNPYTVAPAWEYTGHFEPARVLAEVEAKRRLIDFAYSHAELIDGEWGCCHGAGEIRRGECPDAQKAADSALRLLALPYADHPDYDEAWRP